MRDIAGTRRAASAASGIRVATLGVPTGAATGGAEPGRGGDPLVGFQPRRREGPPAVGEEGATAPRQGLTESEGGWEGAGLPLGEQPLGKGGICGAKRTGEGERALRRDGGDLGKEAARRRGTGGGPAGESRSRKQEEREPGRRGGECRGRRRRGQRARRAKEPAAKTAWDWILLALCLWSTLRVGTALVLKGNRVEGEVFAFDALQCDNSHALARYSGRQFCDWGRIKTDNSVQRSAVGTRNSFPSDCLQEEAVHDEGSVRGFRAQQTCPPEHYRVQRR